MAPLLRTFWLSSCPLLSAVAIVHGPVEQTTCIDIEHYLKFENSIGKAPSVSPEDFTQTVLQTLQSDVQMVSGHIAPCKCPGSTIVPSGAQDNRITELVRALKTIRLSI